MFAKTKWKRLLNKVTTFLQEVEWIWKSENHLNALQGLNYIDKNMSILKIMCFCHKMLLLFSFSISEMCVLYRLTVMAVNLIIWQLLWHFTITFSVDWTWVVTFIIWSWRLRAHKATMSRINLPIVLTWFHLRYLTPGYHLDNNCLPMVTEESILDLWIAVIRTFTSITKHDLRLKSSDILLFPPVPRILSKLISRTAHIHARNFRSKLAEKTILVNR